VIAGTGSVAFALGRDGGIRRAGGWGPGLGDPGSGTAIGRAALRHVATALDAGRADSLTEIFSQHFLIADPSDVIRVVYGGVFEPSVYASAVLDSAAHGDEPSRRLVTGEIGRLAEESAIVMSDAVEPRFALLGGLTSNSWYASTLSDCLRSLRAGWVRAVPNGPPEQGALRLAQKLR